MLAVATVSLIAGMVDDLRSRKVHNGLVLALLGLTILASLYFRGFHGSWTGLQAFALALALTIPLFGMRVLGGGDVKLFCVFALALDPISMLWTLAYSIVWGALFGVTRATMNKQLLMLVRNTYRIAGRQKIQIQEIHKIPYTFAMLLGWFTQLTYMRFGGLL